MSTNRRRAIGVALRISLGGNQRVAVRIPQPKSWNPALDFLEAQKTIFEKKPFDALSALELYQDMESPDSLKAFHFSIWKEEASKEVVRVILQGYKPIVLGLATISAEGFTKDRNGQVSPLQVTDLYAFM